MSIHRDNTYFHTLNKGRSIIFLFCLAMCNVSFAQEANANKENTIVAPQSSTTEHSGRFNDQKIDYKVIAGDTHLLDDEGKPKASIFSTAYFRTDLKDASQRPLIFVFNGGPGSSSVWLHLGVFGPKIVQIPSDAEPVPSAPYTIKDNEHSLLDIADMVFIDPVGTGYSKALGEYTGKDFWGVKEDADILAQFVRVFITKHQRWNSPKYLAGESYGTTRAAVMTRALQEGWGSIDLSGVFLISSIVDFQTGDFAPGNDLPFVTFLPTYAATAWYHDALPDKSEWDSLESFLNEVRDFALKDYASTLILGDLATPEQLNLITEKLHQYTGLSKNYIQSSNYRIDEMLFMKELLRDRGLSVGRLDSRYLGEDASNVEARFETDPSGYAIDGAYTAAIHSYLASDLGVLRETPYHILSGEVFGNWNWLYESSPRSQGFLNTSQHLARAQRQNPAFRIFVANGYYDLATPFFATEYSMNHAGIDKNRLTMQYYPAGHMMYIHHPSLKALANDMRSFLNEARQ
uniref:S10 family peptidase n=1 Tax=Ningiella ruwaisensis TaxID=2364274 RepID=UPI001F4FA408|nr:peptidase S10 [Ningiella ruwaisensis]